MKVLLVNKFLYPKGGAETYVFAVGKLLEKHGHEVQYFGLRNTKNIVGNTADSFVKDMDFSKGVWKNISAPLRIIYNHLVSSMEMRYSLNIVMYMKKLSIKSRLR